MEITRTEISKTTKDEWCSGEIDGFVIAATVSGTAMSNGVVLESNAKVGEFERHDGLLSVVTADNTQAERVNRAVDDFIKAVEQ